MWLLVNVIESFHSENKHGIGLPFGNLILQLFANVYMNAFDQWIKHKLKIQHYIRYADDFVALSRDKKWLGKVVDEIRDFLIQKLNLTLHPSKIIFKTRTSGIDFSGWVRFPDYKTLRVKTKQRMFKRLADNSRPEVMRSYPGLLTHGDTFKIEKDLRNIYWLLAG